MKGVGCSQGDNSLAQPRSELERLGQGKDRGGRDDELDWDRWGPVEGIEVEEIPACECLGHFGLNLPTAFERM